MPVPTILIAPDSFKGTFSARDVAAAIAGGILEVRGRDGPDDSCGRGRLPVSAAPHGRDDSHGRDLPQGRDRPHSRDGERVIDAGIVRLPIGDGGEGTLDALVAAFDGTVVRCTVSGPLGDPVDGCFARIGPGTAVVETASASGLTLVPEDRRDAWAASTRGTGELIAAAVEDGAEHVIVGVGGSATTDGGLGALEELDRRGIEVRLTVVCDVDTPWEDAPRIFAPQKGADLATVHRLEYRLSALAERAPRDPRGVPRTGAAGGLSGGLWAFHGAELLPGAAYVLDAVEFDARLATASLVVTGEGGLDEQTFAGKAVGEVARRAGAAGVPCVAVVGRSALAPARARELGLADVLTAPTLDALRAAGRRIAIASARMRANA